MNPRSKVVVTCDFSPRLGQKLGDRGHFIDASIQAGRVESIPGTEGEIEDMRRELDFLAFFEGRRVHERI
jgi:hypothetical protein